MKQKNVSIGIFDSGVGGLSVFKEIYNLLPGCRYLYFADNSYCPYGTKPKSQIVERARLITRFLIERGAEIVVVACNTATAASIDILRLEFNIPFIGMEPAVKPAALASKSRVIGVLATKGTLSGQLYHNTLEKYASDVRVIETEGAGLVGLVEEGKLKGFETAELLERYLRPMINEGADNIVLGCTHYPFLMEEIIKITGEHATVIDPAPAVARHLYDTLEKEESRMPKKEMEGDLITSPLFFCTGSPEILMKLAGTIFKGITEKNFHMISI